MDTQATRVSGNASDKIPDCAAFERCITHPGEHLAPESAEFFLGPKGNTSAANAYDADQQQLFLDFVATICFVTN